MKTALLVAFAFLAASHLGMAQVSLSSNIVFVCDSEPKAKLTVTNTSNKVQHVSLGTRFGMPAWDTLGRVTLRYEDETIRQEHDARASGNAAASSHPRDARGRVTFTPNAFVLNAGESREVIFTARNSKLDTGSYWMRVEVTSTEVLKTDVASTDVPEVLVSTGPDAEVVNVRMNEDNALAGPLLESPLAGPKHGRAYPEIRHNPPLKASDVVVQTIPLLFVQGAANVRLSERKLVLNSDANRRPHLLVSTGPIGNAPFIGELGILILNNNTVVKARKIPVDLYTSGRICLLHSGTGLPCGEYTMQLYWVIGRENELPKYTTEPETVVDSFTFKVDRSGDLALGSE